MSRRSLALLDSVEHFINEMLQGVLLLKIPAGRTLYSGPQVSHFLRSLTPLANGGTDMGTSRRSCAQLDFRDNFKAKLLRNSQASIMRKDKTRLHSIFFLIPF